MPSLYVGGYFSQIVISALYPVSAIESPATLSGAVMDRILTYQFPIDNAGMVVAALTNIELQVVLSPFGYNNVESSKLAAADIPEIELIQIVKTLNNIEAEGKLSGAAITAVMLQQIVITYTNRESSKLTDAAITAITLV